jgi:N-methylhydantoinase B
VKNVVAILDEDGGRVELPSKITDYRVRQGQLISFETAGGGGYGDPGERDLEHVEADLRAGYITPGEQLEDAYRVVLDEAGEIDASATADRRAAAVLHE